MAIQDVPLGSGVSFPDGGGKGGCHVADLPWYLPREGQALKVQF